MKSSISRSAAWLFTTPEENADEVLAACRSSITRRKSSRVDDCFRRPGQVWSCSHPQVEQFLGPTLEPAVMLLLTYLFLAARYWFRAPLVGIVLALALYAVGLAVALF